MTGCILFVGGNAVHWRARRQLIVSNDICEAELYALNVGLKASLPFGNLLNEMRIVQKRGRAIMILSDNESAVNIANGGLRSKSRHYELTLLHVNFISGGLVRLSETRSAANLADLFTKMADYANYKPLCKVINLVDVRKIIKGLTAKK